MYIYALVEGNIWIWGHKNVLDQLKVCPLTIKFYYFEFPLLCIVAIQFSVTACYIFVYICLFIFHHHHHRRLCLVIIVFIPWSLPSFSYKQLSTIFSIFLAFFHLTFSICLPFRLLILSISFCVVSCSLSLPISLFPLFI